MTEAGDKLAHVCPDVQLRPFPYPYRSMLAICSDLDSTPDKDVYWEIMRFLNTQEVTSMGPGVGLEVGNSIHFRAIAPQFSYWDTDDAGREMVHTLIRSGHIDCLHSFGECVYERDEAKRALAELERHDCHLEVWVDHGGAVTNFGPDIMQGHGDEPRHPAYHADLTIEHGIKYVWRGRTTSVTGQGIPARLGGTFTWHHPVASGRTLLKETAKQWLARTGSRKYAMHRSNNILSPTTLRDGSPVYEFMRCNPHWGGVSSCDTGRGIGEVITDKMLNRLSARGGTCIVYTHLGKVENPSVPFNQQAVRAFHRLAQASRNGSVLVTTTRRLLGYHRAIGEIEYDCRQDGRILHIAVDTQTASRHCGRPSRQDLDGLTFYVPETGRVHMTIDGQEVTDLKYNAPDHTGRSSVSLPWPPLQFPGI